MYGIIIEHDLVTIEIKPVSQALLLIKDNPETLQIISHNPRDLDVLQMILGMKMGFKKGKISILEENIENSDSRQEFIPKAYDGVIEDFGQKSISADKVSLSKSTDQKTKIRKKKNKIITEQVGGTAKDKNRRGNKSSKKYLKETVGGYDVLSSMRKDQLVNVIDEQQKLIEIYEKKGGGSRAMWWKKLSTLSPIERHVLKLSYNKSSTVYGISNELNLTFNQVVQLRRSAIAKYARFLQQKLDDEVTFLA